MKLYLTTHYLKDYFVGKSPLLSGKILDNKQWGSFVSLRSIKEHILFGIYHHFYLKVNDYPVYVIKNFSLTETFSPEIENTGWSDYTALPDMTSNWDKTKIWRIFYQSTTF
jgi:hypothetical protein